jgi:cell wall-associated NlpC family hydrolase
MVTIILPATAEAVKASRRRKAVVNNQLGQRCTHRHVAPISWMMGRASFVLALTSLMAACASSGAVPKPFPLPGSAGAPSPTAPDDPTVPGTIRTAPSAPAAPALDGYSISSTALSLRGAPYRDGGSDPQGFDCSGFVQYVYGQHGVIVPRDVRQQFGVGHDVTPQSLAPGDLVFFTTIAPGASHVGIAVGGDQFVHAPSTHGVVRVENLSAQYWSSRFVGARRVN